MQAFIICGGKGTRVKEYTDKYNCEKHEIPINGKPFIGYMEDWLYEYVKAINYVTVSDVGTGGAMIYEYENIMNRWDTPYLFIYGDCYCPFNIIDAYKYFTYVDADVLVITKKVDVPDYGWIRTRFGTDEIFKYVRNHDETEYQTNIGTYIFNAKALEFMYNTCEGYPSSFEKDYMESGLLFQHLNVVGYSMFDSIPYYDVGTPERIESTKLILGVDS